MLAGCSSSSPKGGSTTVPPLNTAASGASTSTGATASAGASASPGANSAVTPESMSDPDLGYTVVSIPANLDPTQTEVLRAYFAYERATWRLWTKNEGLDTISTVATGEVLAKVQHNASKRNGELTRPPVRISVSEVTASADGDGYAVAACVDQTRTTFVDAQGNDTTKPQQQVYVPIIEIMKKTSDGTWKASQEEHGEVNTCSVSN